MTPSTHAAQAYRRTAVQSASPVQLIVMLYDGALRFLLEAREADACGNLTARAAAVSRTLDIVTECQNTLNIKEGGNIARELDRLYEYMVTRLLDVAIKRDMTGIDEVYKLMSTLREAWSEAAAQVPGTVGTSQPAVAGAYAARP